MLRRAWPGQSCYKARVSKNSLFGMSGHFAVLSEFLRGYNVAIPVVDTGDDAIVINDREHALRRLQVKSGNPRNLAGYATEVDFQLKRKQLSDPDGAPLFYMFMAWVWDRWSWVLISREALNKRKEEAEASVTTKRSKGRPRKRDTDTKSDDLKVTIKFSLDPSTGEEIAALWEKPLIEYLNHWPEEWPDLQPGRTLQAAHPSGRRRSPLEAQAAADAPETSQ